MRPLLQILMLATAFSFSFAFHENATLDTIENKIGENCTSAAIYEFPNDGFTQKQRREGCITVHIFLTAYCFIILSIVCDDYFVPGIQTLVKQLKISEDVAGASFMAITSASPELFINCIGTFITQGDLGVGTVVGSNVFNILGAPACCGLFARMAFQFEKWSILRDGLIYAISVILLIITLHDDEVYWYEALVFVITYFIYIAVMYYDKTIYKKFENFWNTKKNSAKEEPVKVNGEQLNLLFENSTVCSKEEFLDSNDIIIDKSNGTEVNEKSEKLDKLEQPIYRKAWKALIWPCVFSMKYTIPNCTKRPKLYPFTLLMCMVWIGLTSYLLAWFITAIGDTISIPDSVMGLSFLAVGSSMPEIVTCIIVSKQGQGIMGMSSALGANTFEVLLCLGLPWLIKTVFYPKIPGVHSIHINSSGLAYNASVLLSTLIFLYICLICNRFRLDWKVGLICLIMYGLFLILGSLIELNVFFLVNLPTCS